MNIHKIINDVDNSINESEHSAEWNAGFNEAIAQIRAAVFEAEEDDRQS